MPSDRDQCSQTISAFATKACVLALKSHMMNFFERMRDLCSDMLWLRPVETENTECRKNLSPLKKRAEPKNNFITMTFWNSIPDVPRDLHTSKCKRPPNRTYDGYLWKPAKRKKFARANNSDLLRALKHLIKTRLYKDSAAKIFVICRTYFLSAEYIFICRIYF